MSYGYTILSSVAIIFASLTGVVFTWRVLGEWVTPRIRYFVAVAAGVFVVIIYGLSTEALSTGFSYTLLGAFLTGGLILEVATSLLPTGHHHHGPHPEHTHSTIDARRMMLGDAIHNVHDGLALVPAFLVSPIVGFGTAAGIFLHELVQETAQFFVLREAGLSTRRALIWNLTVSTTMLVGVGLALALVELGNIEHFLVAFSAGGFTYILLRDLLPSIVRHALQEQRVRSYALAFILGLSAMLAVSLLAPHEVHEEGLPLPEGFGLALR